MQIPATQNTKRKILLLDDEERILIALRAVLRHEYAVTIVTEGRDALELLKKEDFHVFISDQRMPNMTGVEVLQQAVEIAPATTRLLLTGYSDLAAIVGSINDGQVFRFINKPWDNNDLLATVREAADIAQSTKTVFKENPDLIVSAKVAVKADEEHHVNKSLPLHIQPNAESVLVLDADPTAAEELPYLMEGKVKSLWAKTPDEALTLLAENPVNIILVDIGVNARTIELMKLLKQQYPHVLSIVATERNESGLIIDLINQVKVFRYLHKPYKKGMLVQYLNSALSMQERFKVAPELVKQQAPKTLVQEAAAVTSSLMDKVRSLAGRLSLRLGSTAKT